MQKCFQAKNLHISSPSTNVFSFHNITVFISTVIFRVSNLYNACSDYFHRIIKMINNHSASKF